MKTQKKHRFLKAPFLVILLFACGTVASWAQKEHSVQGTVHIMSLDEYGNARCSGMSIPDFETQFGIQANRGIDFSSLQYEEFATLETATIVVSYTGFSAEAEAAFQRAVEIWSRLIYSPITIKVDAAWSPMDPGILGGAGPTNFWSGGSLPVADTFYPNPLADKIAELDLDAVVGGGPQADITATFNSAFTGWYFGLDGNPGPSQADFVSTVLHELGHGLGFVDTFNVTGTLGSWGIPNPVIYDRFVENGSGTGLLDTGTFPNPSSALAAALESEDVYFNGPSTGVARLHAPSTYLPGTSIAHLDEFEYPEGDPNALMTAGINGGEAVHHPGPITLGIFEDEGWTVYSNLNCSFGCDVGIGTSTPIASLHVDRSDGSARVLVTENEPSEAVRTLFQLENYGAPRFALRNSSSGVEWSFQQSGPGNFLISLEGTGGPEMQVYQSGRVRMGPSGTANFDLAPNGNLTIAGDLTANGFSYPSDRSLKENIRHLDTEEILVRLSSLEVSRWSYRHDEGQVQHVGPMAQDFYQLFGLGQDARRLNPVDTTGVALAAIQGLYRKLQLREDEIDALKERLGEIDLLKAELAEIRSSLHRIP